MRMQDKIQQLLNHIRESATDRANGCHYTAEHILAAVSELEQELFPDSPKASDSQDLQPQVQFFAMHPDDYAEMQKRAEVGRVLLDNGYELDTVQVMVVKARAYDMVRPSFQTGLDSVQIAEGKLR